ncbi:hypothetical protein K8R61_01785 [bacterium]|nr:hypothetical protein [bacterium]
MKIYYDPSQDEIVDNFYLDFLDEISVEKKNEFKEWLHKEAFLKAFVNGEIKDIKKDILDFNQNIREQGESFWIRSGGTTKKIFEADEQKLYELELAGKEIISMQSYMSAVKVGKINPANLLLKLEDFISTEEQEKVVTENPKLLKIDGEIFALNYSRQGYDCKLTCRVTEEFARKTKLEVLSLPSGRTVELHCEDHFAKSFPELVEKLEQEKVKLDWSKVCDQNMTDWTTDDKEVIKLLSKVGNKVEMEINDTGKPIVGFTSLLCRFGEHSLEWKIYLEEREYGDDKKTYWSLVKFLKNSVKMDITIIQEKGLFWKINFGGNWALTSLGKTLESHFNHLIKKYSRGLTPQNIEERIKTLKKEIEASKKEIGGQHTEIQFLEETLKKASSSLEEAAYKDVKNFCELAIEATDKIISVVKEIRK